MENSTSAPLSINDLFKTFHNFSAIDYVVFTAMLLGCSGIGLFYAARSKPKKGGDEATEYLMGGRNMALFPVSMSLIASFISGITLLGTPTEVYLRGTQYLFIVIGFFFSGYIAVNAILPVFYDLQISSTYEYLYLRFDNKVRLFGSILFTISLTCWLPIVIYVPALAFNQVTGVNVHIVTPIVCLVCIFYTSVGGLKAVVWTDVVQTIIMIGAILTVIIKALIDVGGLQTLWDLNYESGRLELPSFSPDPTVRHSIFTLFIGGTIHMLQGGIVNQNMIQRFLTLPSYKLVRKSLWLYVFGVNGFVLICGFIGLIAYGTYHDCDPLTTGLARAKDQVVPLLVMQSTGFIPGMPGLFVAGVFSAALSSLSTGLNSMSAVVLEDFVKPNRSTPLSEHATRIILRSVVVVFGVICVALVFVVEQLGSVLQLSMSLSAIASGASFGIFISGMFLPWTNSKGALYGGTIGMLVIAVISTGAQRAQAIGAVAISSKMMSVEGCDYTYDVSLMQTIVNETVSASIATASSFDTFPLFRLSYLYFTPLGGCITIIFASIISYLTGGNDIKEKDTKLFSPIIQRWLEKGNENTPEEKQLLEIAIKPKSNVKK